MQFYVVVAAVLLLISFIGFIIYCAKGGNLLIGLFLAASLWFLLGTGYNLFKVASDGWMINSSTGVLDKSTNAWNVIIDSVNTVFHKGPSGYGGTIVIIIFASWFGRVLVDTGIAKALIKKVVELAGDAQLVTVILVSIVSAALFTSIFGPGSVMAVGAIILPILFSIGVNKKLAVGAYVMSVAAGMYVNGGYISQFSGNDLFKGLWSIAGFSGKFTGATWIMFGVHVVIMIGFIIFTYITTKNKVRAWAIPEEEQAGGEIGGDVTGKSFIVPFIPIILSLITSIIGIFVKDFAQFPVIFTFAVGILFGLLLTGNLKTYRKAIDTTQKTLFNGISDVALLIGMLLILNMFSASASMVAPLITKALGTSMNFMVDKPWILLIVFMVLAPLALFRGPFMIWGSGIALATVISIIFVGSGAVAGAIPVLLALFYVQPVSLVANSCPTQSWNMWALSYSKYETSEFIKTNVIWSWGLTAINMFILYAMIVGF